ncbi:MAG: cell division protein FtsZ [Candidatus Omnitrophica bacterium]|nr:Cell division protein FtsZ [bacterium]NUN96972.1 cell division protein FtsZ [Candidatus Omnitrophota bacterium]
MIYMLDEPVNKPRIVVVGVGGAGTNAVESMESTSLKGVEFVAVNTDVQSLASTQTERTLHIGAKVTQGLGTGANPLLGEQAAEEDRALIAETLEGADLVFICCGLGGGTGTGASPVIADVAREMGALVVALCTKPFDFEGSVRHRIAERGQRELREKVDTLITIPNQRLLTLVDDRTTLVEAFKISDSMLMQCVQSIADLITKPGQINADFADIRAIMNQQGGAVMGVGHGEGPDRALMAFQQASSNPLMEEVVIEGAKGLLINVTTGYDVTLHELNRAIEEQIHPKADPDANIIFGVVLEENLTNRMHVTILATGFDRDSREKDLSEPAREQTRSYSGDDLGYERPAYLAKSEKARGYVDDSDRELEPVAAAPEKEPARDFRRGRVGRGSDILPAIFGSGGGL